MEPYKAPSSTSVVGVSALITILCIGIAAYLALRGDAFAALLPLAIIVVGLVFTIRSYSITPDAVLIHRLFWCTRLPLAGLQSAEVAPDIMRGGIRMFGNGGFFSVSGWFRNPALGSYRAFVTDLHRTVVLRYAARPVVLSPVGPEEFVHDIRMQLQAA